MIPFTTKCWLLSGNKVEGNQYSINSSLADYCYINTDSNHFDVGKFVYGWFKNDEFLEADKDLTTRLLKYLQRYYLDLTNPLLSPVIVGLLCQQMSRTPVDLLFELEATNPSHWKVLHVSLLEHMMLEEPVDIIGFYRWLAKYISTGSVKPSVVENYWKPYSMDIDIPILDVLKAQGLFVPTGKREVISYRWSDRYLPQYICNISYYLTEVYRLRCLTQGITSVRHYDYRFLPDRHTKKLRIET